MTDITRERSTDRDVEIETGNIQSDELEEARRRRMTEDEEPMAEPF
jgi:hypothetical protein